MERDKLTVRNTQSYCRACLTFLKNDDLRVTEWNLKSWIHYIIKDKVDNNLIDKLPKWQCKNCNDETTNFKEILEETIEAGQALIHLPKEDNMTADALRKLKSYCRICLLRLRETTGLKNVYRMPILRNWFEKFAGLNLSIHMEFFPEVVCMDCDSKLTKALLFCELANESYNFMQKKLNQNDANVKEIDCDISNNKKSVEANDDNNDCNSRIETLSTTKVVPKSKNRIQKRPLLSCNKCNKRFQKSFLLLAHVRGVHEGILKPFECELCKKTYKNSENLRVHLKLAHSNLRPYKCKFCPDTFRFSRNVRLHEMIHLNSYPFLCDFCNKGFRDRTALKTHLKNTKSHRNTICVLCEEPFTNKYALEQHLISKHKKTKPKCSFCGKLFSTNFALSRHKRTIHEQN